MEEMLRRVARRWTTGYNACEDNTSGVVLLCSPEDEQFYKDALSRQLTLEARESSSNGTIMSIWAVVFFLLTLGIACYPRGGGILVSVGMSSLFGFLGFYTLLVTIIYRLRAADIRNTIIVNRLMGRL